MGTITEIYDFLRILYARVGQGFCPKCDQPIAAQTKDQIVGSIMQIPKGTNYEMLAPVVRMQKGEHRDLFTDLLKKGFTKARVDGQMMSLGSEINLDRSKRHNVEVVIDRITAKEGIRSRVAESVESALKIGKGTLIVTTEDEADGAEQPDKPDAPDAEADLEEAPAKGKGKTKTKRKSRGRKTVTNQRDRVYSADYACAKCAISFSAPTPQMFSFNLSLIHI